jgi:hypothetical protein
VGGARGRASALDQRKLDENASSERGRAKTAPFFNSLYFKILRWFQKRKKSP